MKISGKITKLDGEKFLAFGFASAADVVDAQGDTIPSAELEKAAYKFLQGGMGGEMHQTIGGAHIVESFFITKEKADLLGVDEEHIGKWWVGFKVDNTELWQKVKGGIYKAFSIGGIAQRG